MAKKNVEQLNGIPNTSDVTIWQDGENKWHWEANIITAIVDEGEQLPGFAPIVENKLQHKHNGPFNDKMEALTDLAGQLK